MLLTWTRIAAVPTRPRRTSAGARVDTAAATATAPQRRIPRAKPPASRRRAARATATIAAPATLPTPIAVLSQP